MIKAILGTVGSFIITPFVLIILIIVGPPIMIYKILSKSCMKFNINKIPKDLSNYKVIITGCANGIGKENVKLFIERGATVIMGFRGGPDGKRGKTIEEEVNKFSKLGGKAIYHELDLGDHTSIYNFAKQAVETVDGKFEILINNAGIMMTDLAATKDGFEQQIGVNHFGHFYLTQLLLPSMEKSDKKDKRIVNLASLAHVWWKDVDFDFAEFMLDHSANASRTDFDWKKLVYGRSKLANILFTNILAKKLQSKGIRCNSVHPGVVATNLAGHMLPKGNVVLSFATKLLLGLFLTAPIDGCLTTMYAASSPEIVEKDYTGMYFGPVGEINKKSRQARDDTFGERLWEYSMEVTVNKWGLL